MSPFADITHMRTYNRGVKAAVGLALLCVVAAFAGPHRSMPISDGWLLQDAAQAPQSAEVISSAGFQPAGWHRATVPGTVLTSLVNDGVYPEPLYGENNRPDRIPDTLCRTTWWYRTVFTSPPAAAGNRIWLNFDGINYLAEVWLNGREMGTIKGAFIRGIFDVTTNLLAGASNVLAVHIFPQPHPGETHEKTIAKGTGPNGGITGMDGPTFLCSIGWDWIPTIRDRDSGIWQEVTLSTTGPVVLENPYVTSDLPLPRTDTADLTVQTTLRNVTDRPQAGTLTGRAQGIAFGQEVSLGPNETRTITLTPATTPSLRLRKPRLWWPNGFGPANLYTLHLAFAVKGVVSDTNGTTVSFGEAA